MEKKEKKKFTTSLFHFLILNLFLYCAQSKMIFIFTFHELRPILTGLHGFLYREMQCSIAVCCQIKYRLTHTKFMPYRVSFDVHLVAYLLCHLSTCCNAKTAMSKYRKNNNFLL